MRERYEDALSLQNCLVSHATGGREDGNAYDLLRGVFLSDPTLKFKVPEFVRTCRTLSQFWAYVKEQSPTYAGRRTLIWAAFRPLLEYLKDEDRSPADGSVTESLELLNAETVTAAWQKALERRIIDPDGAITSARTLLETVCKHVLEDWSVEYDDKWDLPKLYREAAGVLNLSPSQHTEQLFKQILGGCVSVVEGLGAVRNRHGDSHGAGRRLLAPQPRHAELAVNLAGAMAQFLVASAVERRQHRPSSGQKAS